MVLKSILKPKWKHHNPIVRVAAVSEMGEEELEILASIVVNDDDLDVKLAAVKKINSLDVLFELCRLELDPIIHKILQDKYQSLLVTSVLDSEDTEIQNSLLNKIKDETVLGNLVVQSKDLDLRLNILSRITSQEVLLHVLLQNCGKAVATAAVELITNKDYLQRVAHEAINKKARQLADKKLEFHSDNNQPTKEEIIKKKLKNLIDNGKKIAELWNEEHIEEEFLKLEQKWAEIDPEMKHPFKKDFDKARQHVADKKLAYHNLQLEKEQDEQRFVLIMAENLSLCEVIENLIGSTENDADNQLQKTVELWNKNQQTLEKITGKSVHDDDLVNRFVKACQRYRKAGKHINKERSEMAVLQSECKKAGRILSGGDVDGAFKILTLVQDRFHAYQFKYLKTDQIKNSFLSIHEQIEAFKEKRSNDEQMRLREEIQKYEAICDELESAANNSNFSATEETVNKLKQARKILKVTPSEDSKALDLRFQKGLDIYFSNRKEHYSKQDWQWWANKTKKEQLIAQVNSIGGSNNLQQVAEIVKEARAAWKNIGPVRRKDSQRLWEKFDNVCNREFERCKPYFEERKKRRAKVLERKKEMALMAEKYSESTDWKEVTGILQKLQKEWKEIGHTDWKNERILAERFRKACNKFFESRRVVFAELEKNRSKNFDAKEKLCELAESLMSNPDWNNSKDFRNLQKQWHQLGAAPKGKEQEIWKRFRNTCDGYYSWLDKQRHQHLKKKEELCEKIEVILSKLSKKTNWQEATREIKTLQAEWSKIGPVTKEKSDEIYDRYSQACNSFYDGLSEFHEARMNKFQENFRKKLMLLDRAEKTINAEQKGENSKELKKLQEEWKQIGPAPREDDSRLNNEFKTVCDAFFDGQRKLFQEMKTLQEANLKQKEILCFQLEKLSGCASKSKKNARNSSILTVADEIKLALEVNFILSGKGDAQSLKKREIKKIQEEWKKIGPVPRKCEREIWNRYQTALDYFYGKNKK